MINSTILPIQMDIANNNNDEEQKLYHIQRIADIDKEPFRTLTAINEHDEMILVSLEVAVEPLIPLLPGIEDYASDAKARCRRVPVDRLSNDESASIMLYTMSWKPMNQCLHIALNKTLRSKDRNQLEPWFRYLKLFLTALSRLPSVDQKIYRLIDLDLSQKYTPGETIVWQGFASCATSIDSLQSEQFSNLINTRVLLTITCHSGKNIRQHSYFQSEDEIILLPQTQFQVDSSSNEINGIYSIELTEICPSPLLYPRHSNKSSFNQSIYQCNHDFNGESSVGELSFRQGDLLKIFDEYRNSEWWKATNCRTKQVGYVPRNNISSINDVTAYEWYFNKTNRVDAKRFLEQIHHDRGTFLVRSSDTVQEEESLSILDFDEDNDFHVKNYRIRRTDQGLFYITKQKQFLSIQNLVNHYQTKRDGLCCLLIHAYKHTEPILSVNQYDFFELDRSQLHPIQFLDQENSDELYKGHYGSRSVTIKYVTTNRRVIDQFLAEAKIMRKLSHKNFVRLYGVCTEKEPILIVTEFLVNGSLLNYLHRPNKTDLQIQIIDFLTQIINGMIYLEKKECIHGHLAARNIYLANDDCIKIGGFGLANLFQDDQFFLDQQSSFSIRWIAPEIQTKKECTTKSDVWSFSILLYEIITYGSIPYSQFLDKEILPLILNGYRIPKPSDCPNEYYQIMSDCWNDNPQHRPTFEVIQQRFNRFIIDYEPIYQKEI